MIQYAACTICNGDVDQRMARDNNGAHYLCSALQAHGLDTPRLTICRTCNGSGVDLPLGWSGIDLNMEAIKQNRRCASCNGTGQ